MPKIEPWPPQPPDMTAEEVVRLSENDPFAVSTNAQIYKFKHAPVVHKSRGSEREFNLQKLAGNCAVKPYGRVLWAPDGNPIIFGFLMELATPLDCALLTTISQRHQTTHQMISCVQKLHSIYGIIHGDIKPQNMLICSDGLLRLCDFHEARRMNEDSVLWEGEVTINYLAPNRSSFYPDHKPLPPTINDDLYALGLSIWQLYSGKVPWEEWYHDDIVELLRRGDTVDVDLISEAGIREYVKNLLRLGGARI